MLKKFLGLLAVGMLLGGLLAGCEGGTDPLNNLNLNGDNDTFSLTLNGVTTVYNDNGTDPEISSWAYAGYTFVIVDTASRLIELWYESTSTGSCSLSPDSATYCLVWVYEGTDVDYSKWYWSESGTLNLTSIANSVGGAIAGSFTDVVMTELVFSDFSENTATASGSFSATRDL